MTAPAFHAESSARLFGGEPDDYIHLHEWMDASKAAYGHFKHRALRHHAFGIAEGVEKFGSYLINSAGKKVAIRYVLEGHVLEDCGGRIPSVQDWLQDMPVKSWMAKATPLKLKGTMEIR